MYFNSTNNFFGEASKFKHWALPIVGFACLALHPTSFPFLICLSLNILIFYLISILMIIPHELGHAVVAYLLGMKIIKIVIGRGRTLAAFQFIGMFWEINQFPTIGMTVFSERSTRFYRLRLFLVIIFGPLTHFLMILVARQFPQDSFLSYFPEIYIFPGLIFYIVNVLMIFNNLFPRFVKSEEKVIPNDGLQILKLPFLSNQEIIQRVTLSYIREGQEWNSRGNYKKSLKIFSQIIQEYSTCMQAYVNRGFIYQSMGDHQKAVEDFNQWIKLEPGNFNAYLHRGNAYYKWRKLDATKLQNAIEDFSKAIQIDPSNMFPYEIRAFIYCYLGDEIKAIKDFTKVVQLNPTTNAYYNRGVTYYQCMNYQASLGDFSQAIEIDPQNISAYYGRGNSKYELDDKVGAFQDYNVAKTLGLHAEIVSEDEHGFYAKGIAYTRLEDRAKAMQSFQKAEKLCLENINAKLLERIREHIKIISDIS
jgi:tetratricopeptide (TPR) repeat protein